MKTLRFNDFANSWSVMVGWRTLSSEAFDPSVHASLQHASLWLMFLTGFLSVSQLHKSLRNVARREIHAQMHTKASAESPGGIVKRKIQSDWCSVTNIWRLAASQIPVWAVGVSVCHWLGNRLILLLYESPVLCYQLILQITDSEWRQMMVLPRALNC